MFISSFHPTRGNSLVYKFVGSARDFASAAGSFLWTLYENRRLQMQIAEMSDHELADIGLIRQDVVDTTALPISSDVGLFLASRAGARIRRLPARLD